MVFKRLIGLSIIPVILVSTGVVALDETIEAQRSIDSKSANIQSRINELDEQAKQDFRQYRSAISRLESLQIYNRQMARLVESQNKEMERIESQIKEIDTIETGALPLMVEMTETLDELVKSDVPFLQSEREERVDNLIDLVDRADVTVGEKYRRILEAYQVELEYGRTIESYRGDLVIGDEARRVEFLRIGRVGLYYLTLDGKSGGRWDAKRGAWQSIDSGYLNSVQDGLRIARDQAPPDLLKLPINAPDL